MVLRTDSFYLLRSGFDEVVFSETAGSWSLDLVPLEEGGSISVGPLVLWLLGAEIFNSPRRSVGDGVSPLIPSLASS
jgi:hypothetical protein